MTGKNDPVEALMRCMPNMKAEILRHADNLDFRDLCEDMMFLLEQIDLSRDPAKRKILTDLKMDLDQELHDFLSKLALTEKSKTWRDR